MKKPSRINKKYWINDIFNAVRFEMDWNRYCHMVKVFEPDEINEGWYILDYIWPPSGKRIKSIVYISGEKVTIHHPEGVCFEKIMDLKIFQYQKMIIL